MGRPGLRTAAPLVVVLCVVAAAYLPSLSGGKVWDDNLLFAQNGVIAGRAPIGHAFREPYTPFVYYRPLTALALRFLGAGGGSMLLPKLLGLCLHLGLTAFVFGFSRRFGAGPVAALAAAALFGLHPVLTEAVAWAASLGDVMAAAWVALALAAAARGLGLLRADAAEERTRSVTESAGRRRVWIGVSTLCFFAALLCKETAAVFPVICAALLVGGKFGHRTAQQPRRSTGSGWVVLLLGQAAVIVFWLLLRDAALRAYGEPRLAWAGHGIGLCLALLGQYVALLLAPFRLSIQHVVDPSRGVGDPRVWTGIAGLCAFLSAAIWTARQRPLAAPAAIWPLAALAPALLFTPPRTGLFAERYLYIPSIGLAVLLAILASAVADRFGHVFRPRADGRRAPAQPIVLATVLVAAVVSFTLVWRRAVIWRSETALFQQAQAADSRASTVAVNLGLALRQAGRKEEAVGLYEKTLRAVEARPPVLTDLDLLALRRMAYETGILLAEKRMFAEAERAFRRALFYDPADEGTLGSLGALLGETGRYAEAHALLERAVRMHPNSKLIRRNLALVLAALDDVPGAAAQYDEILRLDPADAAAAAFRRAHQAP